jgi:fructose-1,6-bisphosphatase/inositol monophosphatase family enzyme
MKTLVELVEPLRRLHDSIRSQVVAACERCSVDTLAGDAQCGSGDVTYMIDHVSESTLLEWFQSELHRFESLVLIGEGLPNGRMTLPEGVDERDARWCIIVDPIDGTRGLMYQKRSAWILTGVAPNTAVRSQQQQPTLPDIELAMQTEIPLVKQHLCDQLWAIRGRGAQGVRYNRLTNESQPIALRPSTATELEHGYATVCRYFPGGRDVLAAIDDALCQRMLVDKPGSVAIFEDQHCTAGQLYGLATGQDRFVADLRPLVQPLITSRGGPLGHCCHPYDLCTKLIAEEAGVIITAATGGPVQSPLDAETNVAWIGYANRDLQSRIEPLLRELLDDLPSS